MNNPRPGHKNNPLSKPWKTLRKFTLPGFENVPVANVLLLYFRATRKSSLTERAAAVAFRFFMALFPGLIFIFTLLPYLPIQRMEEQLIQILSQFFNENSQPTILKSLNQLLHQPKNGLLSLSLLLTLFFSTSGIYGLMQAFNHSALISETRSAWKQRILAFLLTLVFIVLLLLIIGIRSYPLSKLALAEINFGIQLLKTFRTLLMLFFLYLGISLLMYVIPAKRMRKGFFSVGALVSGIFFILFTNTLLWFANTFNSYHQLYGILGSIPLVLTWLYLNALALLIGFELNLSIRHASASELP
jgi:membrane protein